MTWKHTTLAALLALAVGGCHSAATLAGHDEMGPHKLKGPATAAMTVSPTDPDGELKQPARSLLARAEREDSTWAH